MTSQSMLDYCAHKAESKCEVNCLHTHTHTHTYKTNDIIRNCFFGRNDTSTWSMVKLKLKGEFIGIFIFS